MRELHIRLDEIKGRRNLALRNAVTFQIIHIVLVYETILFYI
jgi:hypothetical protein